MNEEEKLAFKNRASKQKCTVTMNDGTTYKAKQLEIDTGSLSWADGERETVVQAKPDEIGEIAFVSRGKGFGDGFVIGFVAGASVGAVLGYLAGEDCSGGSGEICISRGGGAVAVALLFGLPCGVVGALVGSGSGAKDIYYSISEHSVEGSVRMENRDVMWLSD